MAKRDLDDAAKIVTSPDLPAPIEGEVELIDRFLRHMEGRIQRSFNDHRALAAFRKDKRTEGIIQYQKNQLQTLATLIANNLQRLNRGTTAGSNRERGT